MRAGEGSPFPNNYRFSRFFLLSLAIFIAINLIPVAYGHPVIVSDNLTQNNPLRALVGQVVRSGHLPTWNLYAWAGSPLAAGFNAGAFFPLIILYVIFPPIIAFAIFLGVLQAIFGLGMYLLFSTLGFERRSSRIIALASPVIGYYAAQSVHLDMVGGLAMLPYLTIAALNGPRSSSITSAIRYGLLMGTAYALVILSGAPEAMIYQAIFIAIVLLLEIIARRPTLATLATFGVVSLVMIILLPEIQLLPGLGFISASQRGALPFDYATAGPFYPSAFLSLVVPFLFGGPGGFMQPNYFGPYGFEEITIYMGLVPLALGLSTMLRIFGSQKDKAQISGEITASRRSLIHLTIAAVFSTTLALGTFTPLEHLMLYVPVYNKQRLPSRNIFALDFVALILSVPALSRFLSKKATDRILVGTSSIIFGLIILASIALSTLRGGLVGALDGVSVNLNGLGEILISSAIQAVLAVTLLAIVLVRRHISAISTQLALVLLIVIDVFTFNFQAYYSSAPTTATAYGSTPQAKTLTNLVKNDGGRFAIFDPNLNYYGALTQVGTPNLNIFNEIPSIAGYSSLALGTYENATNSHKQASFDPTLLYSQLGYNLELTTVVTGPIYFQTRLQASDFAIPIPKPITIGTGQPNRELHHESIFTGIPVTTRTIILTFDHYDSTNKNLIPYQNLNQSSIVALGVVETGTKKVVYARLSRTFSTQARSIYAYQYTFSRPTTFDEIIATQLLPTGTTNPAKAIAAGITIPQSNSNLAIDGELSGYLTPSNYTEGPAIGPLLTFTAKKTLTGVKRLAKLHPSPPTIISPLSSIKLIRATQNVNGKLDYSFLSEKRMGVTISETFTDGWKASISSKGQITHPPVHACGIFLCVMVPSGKSQLTLTYVTPKLRAGAMLTFGGLILWVALFLLSSPRAYFRRKP